MKHQFDNASNGHILIDDCTNARKINYNGLNIITSNVTVQQLEMLYTGGDALLTVEDGPAAGQSTFGGDNGGVDTFRFPSR